MNYPKYKIPFACGVMYQEKLYISSIAGNDLFQYDWMTGKLSYFLSFDEEKDVEYLYRCAIIYKNKAWFIPQCAEKIAVVDLETRNVDYIKVNYKWIESRVSFKFSTAGIFENHFLYLVPYDIDTLLIINMLTGEVIEHNGISSHEQKYCDAVYINEWLYLIPWTASSALKLYVKNGERKAFSWQWGKQQYIRAILDKENEEVWMVPASASQIAIYDLKGNSWNTINYEGKLIEHSCDYINSIYGKIIDDNVIICPYDSDQIMLVGRRSKIIEKTIIKNKSATPFFMKIVDGKEFYAIVEGSNIIFKYNKGKNTFERKFACVDNSSKFWNCRDEKIEEKVKNNTTFNEMYGSDLSAYLKNIKLCE